MRGDVRSNVKVLIIKATIGLLTAAVIGHIVKAEIKVLDDVEDRYLPPKKKKQEKEVS